MYTGLNTTEGFSLCLALMFISIVVQWVFSAISINVTNYEKPLFGAVVSGIVSWQKKTPIT